MATGFDDYDEPGEGCDNLSPVDTFCDAPYTFPGGKDNLPWTTESGWTIYNMPPVADAGVGQAVGEGSTVTLDAGGSTDPNGDPLTYGWELLSSTGPPVTLSSTTSVSPSFATTDDGVYTFQVTVDDGKGGTDTDEVTITVNNVAPAVSISQPEGGSLFDVFFDPVGLNASFSDPGTDDGPWDFTIDWGDGASDAGSIANQSVPVTGTHTYTSAGYKTITVCVTDNDSATGCTSVGISVITPEQRIGLLIGDVEGLVGSGVVNRGQGNALMVTLEAALQSLERDNVNAATNQIQAFINQVNAFISAGTLTPEQGQSLIGAAERVITLLGS